MTTPDQVPAPPSAEPGVTPQVPVSQMTDADLVELYQQICGRNSLWQTREMHDRMFELRSEVLRRLAHPSVQREAGQAGEALEVLAHYFDYFHGTKGGLPEGMSERARILLGRTRFN